ncbi:MAG: amidase, partial [Clostridia bacterium]|nr:amidase [Clostridia bacterium]
MRLFLRSCITIWLLLSLLMPLSLACMAEGETSNGKESLLSALYEADIATLREAIDLRLITCRELTAYYLERIETYNNTYNCFITLCDNALEEAEKRDAAIADGTASGSLFGIPIVVKDNIDYEGFHTTNGYKKTNDQIASASATIVKNLLDEGAVILGKTNMSTAAQEARISRSKAVGETKNAYDVLLASGGSSGGSAVATSLNFAAGSLGTDTNSSLRYPAALNGCVSLRPTQGLLPRDGLVILNAKRDTAGAITRTVMDQAILLDALVGGGNYAASLDENVLKGLRIGVLKELSGPIPSLSDRKESMIDGEILAAFARAVTELQAYGAEVIEVSLPKIFTMSNACKEDRKGSAKAKETLYAAFEALLAENNIKAVVFPTYLHSPQYTGVTEEGALRVYEQTYINNVSILSPPTGLPEISLPIGIHSRGAGIGMEIAGLKNEEQLLLNIAYTYTLHCNHRVVPEGAADLYKAYYTDSLQGLIEAYRNPPPDETEEITSPESSE